MSNLKERQRKTMVKVSALQGKVVTLMVKMEALENKFNDFEASLVIVPTLSVVKSGTVEKGKKPTVKKVAKKKVARKRS